MDCAAGGMVVVGVDPKIGLVTEGDPETTAFELYTGRPKALAGMVGALAVLTLSRKLDLGL